MLITASLITTRSFIQITKCRISTVSNCGTFNTVWFILGLVVPLLRKLTVYITIITFVAQIFHLPQLHRGNLWTEAAFSWQLFQVMKVNYCVTILKIPRVQNVTVDIRSIDIKHLFLFNFSRATRSGGGKEVVLICFRRKSNQVSAHNWSIWSIGKRRCSEGINGN